MIATEPKFLVSEVAAKLKADRRHVSDLLYADSKLSERCPVVAGRRLIPASEVEPIRFALHRLGRPVEFPAPEGGAR